MLIALANPTYTYILECVLVHITLPKYVGHDCRHVFCLIAIADDVYGRQIRGGGGYSGEVKLFWSTPFFYTLLPG